MHLFDEKISDVCARDRAASPVLGVAQHLVPAGLRPACEDDGPDDNPIEPAAPHNGLLDILVIIGAAEQKLEEDGLKRTELCAAFAAGRPKSPRSRSRLDRFPSNAGANK